MRASYAIRNNEILVFASQEGRDRFCSRAIFERTSVKAISGNEARRLYGSVPSHDTCRDNFANDTRSYFHILPIRGC